METLKIKRRTEDEMRQIASEMSEKLTIREYDDGSSVDYQRDTTPEEKSILEDIFYSAMLTLNFHGNQLTRDKIQVIKDFAEFQGDVQMQRIGTHINGYDTVYNPLGHYIEKNLERQKDAREL